ncbi:MAG: hypothetical protein COT71_00005 [Candidatus Andersenbacteria bacterium CG10_big_fil_rev_8_21_14_0_10_54_11]|uniref:Lipopolysaccharide heptosyltransferase II n=1 Tax=Candidatus Andersenbacteria bacterium CG10_big_fil_rev_8_21_14_0_10_54_11 TaxID=1974485 RepID=A0A2M6X0G7_9BACT|nr:MAG: hypothetical protein COT71_00005 [Candidatus Andersenbacteria bacterium CG10_big_fil_rev_8_21_14_0_10_54_11]
MSNNRILLLSLSGIGNYIMHTPFIREVKRQRPNWRLTLWCAPRGQAVFARSNPLIDEVIEFPMQSPFYKDLPLLLRLRQQKISSPFKGNKRDSQYRFDTAVMLSPGQLIKGAAYMFAAGIPQRIAHQYPFRGTSRSGFLLTDSIPEEPDIHDIEQNLNLLPLLGLHLPLVNEARVNSSSPPSLNKRSGQVGYKLDISPEIHQKAAQLLKNLKVMGDKPLIGLHPGSAPDTGYKRWPTDRFAAVARVLLEKYDTRILIFGGPDEKELKERLAAQILLLLKRGKGDAPVTVISSDLLTTAALTQKCSLFISNDSGLMHIAAASNTPTIGLFGPTSEIETGPRGLRSYTLRAPGTKPVYNTEANASLGNNCHESLLQLTTERVLMKAQKILQEE